MNMNLFLFRNGGVSLPLQRVISKRFLTSTAKESSKDDIDIKSLEQETIPLDEVVVLTEEELEQKRNKSRLNAGDRNVVHNRVPRNEIIHPFQTTVKYKRRMFGRYGMEASDVPLGIAWPTKEEVEDMKEYESVLYPETIQQMWDKITKKKVADAEAIKARDEAVAQNVLKLDKWVAELNARVAKKEADALAARERKERLMEEVRRHFGFKINPKDPKVKEMLEQKEKDEKKRQKAAKKLAKEQKMLAMISGSAESMEKKETAASSDSKSSQITK